MLLPSFRDSRCYRCRRPWWAVTIHTVRYALAAGQFALCVSCWDASTLDQRITAHQWTTIHYGPAEYWYAIVRAIRHNPDEDR